MSELRLYIATVMHLKPSQIFYRIWRKLGGNTPLRRGFISRPDVSKANIGSIPVLSELDFDPPFLARFDVDAILNDRVELLHHEEYVDWCESWHMNLSTPLWRFNFHYHEYLLPLAKAYLDTGNERYLNKAKAIIGSWIEACPRSKGGVAWDSYVIAMRVVNWLAFLGELSSELEGDKLFVAQVNESLAEQLVHLSQHLEKDLLANHYLEDLKALVILACYFNDRETLTFSLLALQEQISEQILPDGMHFELSPMYHKIVLEDLLRAALFLKDYGYSTAELIGGFRLQDMCDVLYSLERNINRTPLFNDCGDNVAKSRDALLQCARKRFGIEARYESELPDAGYALIERETAAGVVKVVFDAGNPGPAYAMGHAHCDALSFECFIDGEPWIVNCGTYAYQDETRLRYKATLSHSTIRLDGVEQHECWGAFRVARYSVAAIEAVSDTTVRGVLFQRGTQSTLRREISIKEDGIYIIDSTEVPSNIESAVIFAYGAPEINGHCVSVGYSPEFGEVCSAIRVMREANGVLETVLHLPAKRK